MLEICQQRRPEVLFAMAFQIVFIGIVKVWISVKIELVRDCMRGYRMRFSSSIAQPVTGYILHRIDRRKCRHFPASSCTREDAYSRSGARGWSLEKMKVGSLRSILLLHIVENLVWIFYAVMRHLERCTMMINRSPTALW